MLQEEQKNPSPCDSGPEAGGLLEPCGTCSVCGVCGGGHTFLTRAALSPGSEDVTGRVPRPGLHISPWPASLHVGLYGVSPVVVGFQAGRGRRKEMFEIPFSSWPSA